MVTPVYAYHGHNRSDHTMVITLRIYNLLVMDVVRLRTMTKKSCFTGGIYVDIPMYILLDMGKRFYIVAKYYQYDTINFDDEMLDLLGLIPELRIPKPGHDESMLDKYKEHHTLDNLTDLERIKLMAPKTAARKRRAKKVEARICNKSKGYHMNKNRTKP